MNRIEVVKAYQYLTILEGIPRFDKTTLKQIRLISKTETYSNFQYENETHKKFYVREYQAISDLESSKCIFEEIVLIHQYQHRNLHKFLGYDLEKNQIEANYVINFYLIFEDIDYELEDKLNENPKYFTPEIIKKLTLQLLSASFYLAQNNEYHSNITPKNIVMISGNFKLSSFAAGRFLPKNTQAMQGNPQYFSPELFEANIQGKKNKTDPSKNDVYSLGLTVLYVASQGEFEGKNSKYRVFDPEADNIKAAKQIVDKNKDMPKCFVNMVDVMLKYNPFERPTISELATFLTQKSQFLEFAELEGGVKIQKAGKNEIKNTNGDIYQNNSIDPKQEENKIAQDKEARVSKILSFNCSLDMAIRQAAQKDGLTTFKKLV